MGENQIPEGHQRNQRTRWEASGTDRVLDHLKKATGVQDSTVPITDYAIVFYQYAS